MENNDNLKFHPEVKINIVSLLLGPVTGAFLIRDNLNKLGKTSGNSVLFFSILFSFLQIIAITNLGDFGVHIGFLSYIFSLVAINVTLSKEERAQIKAIKNYAPAGKLVIYGLGIELLIVFLSLFLII